MKTFKNATFVTTLVLAMTCLSGCTSRMFDFTIISSKNVEIDRMSSFEKADSRVVGEDLIHIIIFIPTGTPNIKEALDAALESVPGAVALLDGVVSWKSFWVPYIYGQSSYIIEGTPLIDTQRASLPKGSSYLIAQVDHKGNIKDTQIVCEKIFNKYKSSSTPFR